MAGDPDSTKDSHLQQALMRAYSARARLFHVGVRKAKMRRLFAEVDSIDPTRCDWSNPKAIGVSARALAVVRSKDIAPFKVFAHPAVLEAMPQLVAYYRNLVAVSQKGMSQLGIPTARFERSKPSKMSDDFALLPAQTFNSIISCVIEGIPDFKLANGRDVVFAEIGTELQGTWVNTIGKGAAKAVEEMIAGHVEAQGRSQAREPGKILLANKWQIVFGSEPDVTFVDPEGVEQIVVEIKGSLDRAGAQTRYGEAKKSFAKALKNNPRCHTIYLASCFTASVADQISADGQVREVVNLTSVLYDPAERERFLKKLFYMVDAPK